MQRAVNSGARGGALYAVLAYVSWGLFPLYFHAITGVAALEIVAHRTLWSLVFLLGVLLVRRHWRWLHEVLRQPRVLGAFALSALLLSSNWVTYVWAISSGHVLDSSLGYFMLPLVNVAIGYFVLHERPRRAQWLAVACATAGVLWLALQAGHPPWIALTLALTFGFYGLLRNIAALGALEGLALETVLLSPLALGALVYFNGLQWSAVFHPDPHTRWLLMGAGPLTALPLLLFAAGARRIPLTTLGVLQYISPTLQFALGVWLFHEAFAPARMFGFSLIWLALLIYSVDSWRAAQRASPPLSPRSAQ